MHVHGRIGQLLERFVVAFVWVFLLLAVCPANAQAIRFRAGQVRVTVPINSGNSTTITNQVNLTGVTNADLSVSGLPTGATAVLTDTNGVVVTTVTTDTNLWLTVNTTNIAEGIYAFSLNASGLDTNGAPVWNGLGRADYPTGINEGNAGQMTSIKHALIDFAGDGKFQVASAGYGDGVRAIDPRDGKVLWTLAAPTPTCPRVVAADIDGRKGDELIYVAGPKLIAITGDRSSGRILWEWQGPANLSMPAIADTDDNGLAEIVVQAADGSVHCIGPLP